MDIKKRFKQCKILVLIKAVRRDVWGQYYVAVFGTPHNVNHTRSKRVIDPFVTCFINPKKNYIHYRVNKSIHPWK